MSKHRYMTAGTGLLPAAAIRPAARLRDLRHRGVSDLEKSEERIFEHEDRLHRHSVQTSVVATRVGDQLSSP